MTGTQYTGFDLRALMILDEKITAGTAQPQIGEILNSRAKDQLSTNRKIMAVDGEIVPSNQFQYGVHYNLGDIIEVQGNSEIIQKSRVTEYIRAQDEAGERTYPTVAMLD